MVREFYDLHLVGLDRSGAARCPRLSLRGDKLGCDAHHWACVSASGMGARRRTYLWILVGITMTDNSIDIVKSLRWRNEEGHLENPTGPIAAQEIDRLRRINADLYEALEFCIERMTEVHGSIPLGESNRLTPAIDRARAALERSKAQGHTEEG